MGSGPVVTQIPLRMRSEFDKGGGGNLPVGWAADGTSVYSASMVRKWTWLGRWESAI
jgi:hypothetical protein